MLSTVVDLPTPLSEFVTAIVNAIDIQMGGDDPIIPRTQKIGPR